MDERWNRINEVFSAWLDAEPQKQSAFLAEACGSDQELRNEVQALIDAHLESHRFIETSVVRDVALVMAEEEELVEIEPQIGPYKILKEIGRGGMGAVYLATRADQEYKKQVAVKLIKRGMDTEQVLHRFRNERQILANFDHPNIARLLDGGSTSNGLPYFVMEHVEGRPLDVYCDENNLSITKRLELFLQVCAAISYAHRNLVVHRDIKPGNILITSDGVPKLLDFGIAKILQPQSESLATSTGFMPMTPEYASPEQALGENVTTISDVYSLGILLYELLTGHLPYHVTAVPAMEVARIITQTAPRAPSTIVKTAHEDVTPDSVSKCREGTPDRLQRRLRGDLDNIVLMALRKEPNRRYQSVEQFSDDIRRHLDGRPVLARQDTLLYRGTKFILRNKVAAAFATLAILAIVIAGAMRWRTNQQAASFQEFGQEAARMEAIMRYAHLLPLHDTQSERKQVSDRLEQIQKRMQALGSVSYGPGYYSMGRGFVALHKYQDAYDHLNRAWQDHNYRVASVANALGLTLAMLYQEKLSEAEWFYDKEELIQQKKELEKKYRDPALQYIQSGASAAEDPEYIQALIAFLEKRYEEALKQTEIAEQKASWLYEAKILQGQIFKAMGDDQRLIGKTDVAANYYDKARAAFLEASRKGQSDSKVYEGLCGLQSSVLSMQLDEKGSSSETLVQEGVRHCETALQADSKNINANLHAAAIYTDFAYAQYLHGVDPAAATDKAADFARAILKFEPENGLAHQALGNAYKTLGGFVQDHGGNPTQPFDQARTHLEKAIVKMPRNAELLSNLGATYINQSRFKRDTGKDPSSFINKAIESLNQAISLSPANFRYRNNLGIAYSWKGMYEKESGKDPSASYKESILQCKKSVEINPAYVNAYIWAGLTSVRLAYHQMSNGENPIPAVDESIAMRKQALKLDPENAYAYMGLGSCFVLKARYLMRQKKDAAQELQFAREYYQKSISLNDKAVTNYSGLGDLETLSARNAITFKQSPESFLNAAEKILQAGIAIGTDSAECLRFLAVVHLVRAEYLFSLGKSGEPEIALGIKAVDRSLKINPKSADGFINRAELFLQRARMLSGTPRVNAAKEAIASFDQAFQLNPEFRKDYDESWTEANRLARIL